MIIQPKTRGFICTTAHPAGCEKNVAEAAARAKKLGGEGPKRVLVIGSSTGYGLACRVAAAFGYGAATIGVALERPAAGSRTATAGWYNTQAFEKLAAAENLTFASLNGDAYSHELKDEAIAAVREKMGQLDLVIYSLAAPKRVDSAGGVTYSSVIKPIGEIYNSKTVDFHTGEVSDVSVSPATEEEIDGTIKVMGGEDWYEWMQALSDANVLANGVQTLAFSYIGPSMTHPVYKDGTIGRAKEDLEQKAALLRDMLAPIGGRALVSVNKALVTQASSAIPVVPLYISLLYRVMKEKGLHEDCTDQMIRMFERLYAPENIGAALPLDSAGRVRMDDYEMQPEIQADVLARWEQVSSENLEQLADLQGYRNDFFSLFGFGLSGIDYEAEVEA